MARKPAALLLALFVSSLFVSSCGSKAATSQKCITDAQCAVDHVCMIGTCLPRGTGRTVAVEILPRTDSTAARTGIANVVLGPGQIALAADDRVVVQGTVTNAPNAHVIVLVANPIPGQADLQFETDLANFKFQLDVGSRLIKSLATIWLIPTIENQHLPPVPFQTMLDSSLTFTFPPAAKMTAIRGVLHDSLNQPASGFLVRAHVRSKVVSNVATTDDTGTYQLVIAPDAVPDDATEMLSIDFTPVDPDSGPRFQTAPFLLAAATANNSKPRVFKMPASLTPAPLRFLVQSSDKGAIPLSDVTVRFRTAIDAGADGVALYEREKRTNALGEVEVLLIPGTASQPRDYEITVVPAPDSPYASKCIAQHPVTNVGSDSQPQYSKTFLLDPKVTLQGTVLANDGSPAATLSVTATQVAVAWECTNAVFASPVSSTTLRTGNYQMLVDPGSYRLEIDPPIGSSVPRLIEDGDLAVVVTTDPVTRHDVTLPPGEVIEGDVKGVDGMLIGSASLRIFQVLCQGETCGGAMRIAPALRAQTRTDMMGHFRAVLPLPLSVP
ncbi:MAG: hypothetical protein H7X95_05345 [Deltaproteobacteria bacterium]|nr:hypothetical protein [Deltaproteobacteria bacterium]